jgi:hypothetical protein
MTHPMKLRVNLSISLMYAQLHYMHDYWACDEDSTVHMSTNHFRHLIVYCMYAKGKFSNGPLYLGSITWWNYICNYLTCKFDDLFVNMISSFDLIVMFNFHILIYVKVMWKSFAQECTFDALLSSLLDPLEGLSMLSCG